MAAGCNWQSKLGTKSSVLHKVDLLDSFGKSDVIDNDLIHAAEEYLMSVLKGKMYPLKRATITDIINMLRATHQFNHRFYCHTLFEMGIWLCLFCLIRCLSSLLDINFVSMDPRNYSCLEKNGFLVPDKCLRQLTPALLKICKSCKGCLTKRCVFLSETSWKLRIKLWLWWKMSKYLQHCVWMIHLLKAIVYSLPTSNPLVIPNKFHLILYWNNWLRFYVYLNCLSVCNNEMANFNKVQIRWKLVTMLCNAYKVYKK